METYSDQFDPGLVMCVGDLVSFCMMLEKEALHSLPLGSEVKAGYAIAIRDIVMECHRMNTEYKSIDFQRELSKNASEEDSHGDVSAWSMEDLNSLIGENRKVSEKSHTPAELGNTKEEILHKLEALLKQLRTM